MHSTTGCVAKTSIEQVEVVLILTTLSCQQPLHESQVPVDKASVPIRHHGVVRPMGAAISPELPESRRDDVGTGADRRPEYSVGLGTG